MHLLTILAFAFLLWQSELPDPWPIIGDVSAAWGLVIVLCQPILLGLAALWAAKRARRMLIERAGSAQAAHRFHHRVTLVLRLALICGFALSVFGTPWPKWFAFGKIIAPLQIVGDLVVLSPYFAGAIALWLAAYPFERTTHDKNVEALNHSETGRRWKLLCYLDFNIRHHLLVIAAPMTLILFAADMLRSYEEILVRFTGWSGTPDVALGVAAAGVFVLAPLILCRVWRTAPLDAGPVRDRLEALCRRIGLRCRGILIWKSDGYMINAAVMGILAPVRFVLLSDALLAAMTPVQIEAVFGHEAGHVRHRHIQHFLVLAYVGWLVVAGVVELVARIVSAPASAQATQSWTMDGIAIAATVLFWGIGFGWVSRRFERQADLFGARCVTPQGRQCLRPCSVHPDENTTLEGDGRVCATGAAVFASALDRVALLSGIPRKERSWRHSSIASRVQFLISAAQDPRRAIRFERLVYWIKVGIWTLAASGTILSAWYWTSIAQAAILAGR